MRKYWTQEETEWLVGNYPNLGAKECSIILKRNPRRVMDKAHSLDLKLKKIFSDCKKCSKCFEEKLISRFYKASRGRGGLSAECMDCTNKREVERCNNDNSYRINKNIRERFKKIIKKISFSKNYEPLLGCTREEFVSHIESQFNGAYSWDSKNLWDIDHIIPVSLLKRFPEKLGIIFNYRNHQPLEKKLNFLIDSGEK